MSIRSWLFGAALAAASTVAVAAHAQGAPDGAAIYDTRCKACHDGGNPRAPSRADLAQRAPADIVTALTSGLMQPMAQGLSDADKQAVAKFLTAAPAEAAAAPARAARPTGAEMPQVEIKNGVVGIDPMCAVNAPIKAGPTDWSNMGVNPNNDRFQRHPGLTAADVPKLKVKWAFSMTGGGQPAVVGDWLWVTNRSGKLYALDTRTGCVHWALGDVVSRTTPMIVKSPLAPSGWATFIAQNDRKVRAFDAQTGKEIWRSPQLDEHPYSTLTGTPMVAGDRLIVPISSIEEAAAMGKAYSCCTFRGSLAALDLKTGKLLWKTSMIDGPMKTIRDKDAGGKVQGPAGAAVWAAPTVDMKRGLVYAVTGDSYTDVDTNGDDAIVALDLKTGAMKWRRQVTEHDNFVMGCGPTGPSGNCPTPLGPDYDFGAAPVLFTLKGGKQVLLAGQKSGIMYGVNPDNGELIWKTIVGAGSALGGIEWGIGADDSYVYVPISDLVYLFNPATASKGKAGIYALNPADGKFVWSAPAPDAPCVYASDKGRPSRCAKAQPAAPAVIPGLVFQGGEDGWFRAYDSKTGKIVWADSTTARTYDTVNGIKGQPGGGIDGMGPTIAGGMVFITSGNNGAARVGSNGVNVLLAYSVDGK
ncbi:PQQ-binding-like beta-propeller repeat protein [Phenylobacterium sp.]|uniref:outer membrane protein assembly factor BamB family protein n=1 Tax=Phenylobacterium sp. TaxID=1871053 RepID=UPI002BE72874|nr:PQQ-binding-like beta-propeller repeat protein [Phenylobacterium sp.]HLZ73398.1 PQQ-binding-like beta-propeller repeat protein [Phenylobacterium sp.]